MNILSRHSHNSNGDGSGLPPRFLFNLFTTMRENEIPLLPSSLVCRLWRDMVQQSSQAAPPVSKRTIVIFTVPFQGHFDVLYRAAKVWQQVWNVEFVVCGWSNLGFPKCDHSIPYTYLQGKTPLTESCPTRFNLQRALDLRDEVMRLCTEEFKNKIDMIVYDFFALEGFLAARTLRIPHACSIPAVPGLFDRTSPFFKDRLEQSKELICKLNQLWLGSTSPSGDTLDGEEIKMVSDGFLVQGQQQLLWGMKGMSRGVADWIRNPLWLYWPCDDVSINDSARTSVYICLGTVVTGNLWELNPATEPFVTELLQRILRKLTEHPQGVQEIVIAIPHRLDILREKIKIESPQIRWVDFADQREELGKARLFITHGGGNSVREALQAKTPMLVIPFFGDQHVSAACVEQSGAGLALPSDSAESALDTHQQSFFRKSLAHLESSLDKLLTNRVSYQKRIQDVVRTSLVSSIPIEKALSEFRVVYWKEGDLLFGINSDRAKAAKIFSQGGHDHFQVGNMVPFSTYGQPQNQFMPRLIDQYHDVLCQPDQAVVEAELQHTQNTPYNQRLELYRRFLMEQGLLPIKKIVKQHLWDCCVASIDVFLNLKASIHVVIDRFDPEINRATLQELLKLRQLWHQFSQIRPQLLFYKLTPHLRRVDPEDELWFGVNRLFPRPRKCFRETIAGQLKDADRQYPLIDSFIKEVTSEAHLPIWHQGRVKSLRSALEKVTQRGFRVVPDLLGFRLIQVWTKNLYAIAERLCQKSQLRIYQRKVTERGKVLFLFGKGENDLRFEIQLWPTVIYTCFESEHDTIYKPRQKPSQTMLAASAVVREEEHRLQNVLDDAVLIKGSKN